MRIDNDSIEKIERIKNESNDTDCIVSISPECPICMNNLDKNNIIIGCCNKSLHIECFMKCILLNNLCPFCRKEYILNDIKLKDNVTDTVIPIQNIDTDTVTTMNQNIFQCNNVLLLILLFFILSRIVQL